MVDFFVQFAQIYFFLNNLKKSAKKGLTNSKICSKIPSPWNKGWSVKLLFLATKIENLHGLVWIKFKRADKNLWKIKRFF